jgi:protein-disulfide isomerase
MEDILDDIRSAIASGAASTPALFIAGERWEGGWEPDALEGALRAAMAG